MCTSLSQLTAGTPRESLLASRAAARHHRGLRGLRGRRQGRRYDKSGAVESGKRGTARVKHKHLNQTALGFMTEKIYIEKHYTKNTFVS